MTNSTPVALFVFNRPGLVRQVMGRIATARPPRLLVVADGPRADHLADKALCEEARAAALEVDWPCDIRTLFGDTNIGPKRRIASGLDWVFSQEREAILLEDDCLPDATFFPYCAELLERYRDDPRVHMIRGSNFLRGYRPTRDSYYFSRFYLTWGWASWSRAWRHFDLEMREWPRLRDSGWLERMLGSPERARTVRKLFDAAHAGLEVWEYQWELSGWLREALAIAPAVNLVTNIGFGPDATHLRDPNHPHAAHPSERLGFPLKHPAKVESLEKADSVEWANVFPRDGWRSRLQRALGALR